MFNLIASSAGGGFTGLTYPDGMDPATVATVIAAAAAGILALTLAYGLGFAAVKRVVGRIFSRG